MASLRKGHCYSKVKRPYTRKSKFKKKGYIKTIPALKIVKFDLGNLRKDFEKRVNLISKNHIQIRQNALESARQLVNRRLHKFLGVNYHLKINPYPHHILRENKMLTGAGADRMQTGMQQSFGKPIGSAAQVKIGQAIITVFVDERDVDIAKSALKLAIHRFPCKCSLEVY